MQGALQAYKAAADLAPGLAANPANCAAAALMLREFKAAAEFAARAAALQPGFVRAHIRAGKACLCMGRFDQVAPLHSPPPKPAHTPQALSVADLPCICDLNVAHVMCFCEDQPSNGTWELSILLSCRGWALG